MLLDFLTGISISKFIPPAWFPNILQILPWNFDQNPLQFIFSYHGPFYPCLDLCTGVPVPSLNRQKIASKQVIPTRLYYFVMNWSFLTPSFLPQDPDFTLAMVMGLGSRSGRSDAFHSVLYRQMGSFERPLSCLQA